MELKDLIGEHVLSGVDIGAKSVLCGDFHEDCEVISFILDGKTYTATEDPEDGYRSCMREIRESSDPVSNTFEGQRVLARMREDDRNESYDVLDLLDMQTGKIVLSVGTGDWDDYYPYWVAKFSPENMGVNAKLAGL